ncbi:unnamed protein product [Ectocarpus sp. CCAP 1310/34]|nr:unnamed protein product [Ectocarpus sp. CCAP 1310/34]
MLSVGPLGDDSEALRLEATARGGASGGGNGGGGGSSSSRSIHAIRCFNAQTDLSALDLLRNGRLGDDDDDDDGNGKALAAAAAGNALGRGKGLLDLDSVPVLRFLLSGGLAPDDCNSSGNNNSSSSNNTGINSNSNSSKNRSSSSSSSSSSGDRVFDLCLTRGERNAEVSQTVEAFRLNRDQARLLWRCATWFRPAEAAGDNDDDESDDDAKEGPGTRGRAKEKEEDQEQGRPTEEGGGGMAGEDGAPVVLVHGVFGAGKSLTLVALCVMVDRIAAADARLRSSRGLPPRPKAEQVRVLLASGTNVAVDRVLMGLVSAGFDDIARLGSHRRTHKSLLDRVVHSSPPGRDAQKAVQSELQAMLKTAVGAERDEIGRALQASKAESFTTDQAKRLREARVTGVTCASATVPLLTRPPRSPRPLPRGGVVSGGNGSNSVAARKTGVATGGAKTAGPWKRPAGVAGSNGRRLGGGRGSAGERGWSGGGGEGRRRGYDIVVLDECSQIVEPMSLLPVAVAQPRRLVLVGDPMQLPPPVARARMPKEAWLEKVNARPGNGDTLEKTLFVRLAKLGVQPLLLGRQYRCHPQMSALASRLFYQGRLTDGVAARDRGPLVPGLAPLTLLDAAGRGAESTAPGGSIKNAFEARAVADVVVSLLRAGSSNGGGAGGGSGGGGVSVASIGIICLYKAQLAQVRRELESASRATPAASSMPSSSSSLDVGVQPGGDGRDEGQQGGGSSVPSCCRDVQVSTVDAFQGAEKDIVIVASTRTERLGFLVSPQRLCVALTRARHHLLVVGEKSVLVTNPLWREVVDASNVVVTLAQMFSSSSTSGGGGGAREKGEPVARSADGAGGEKSGCWK